MRNFKLSLAGVAIAVLAAIATPGTATATTPENPDTVTIDGRTYGPEDGLELETRRFEVTPGGDPVGETFGNTAARADYGTSYARSTETAQFVYTGKAKAAANIYQGKRIIAVCIWYTRGGSRVSGEACSNASNPGGRWRAGPEVTLRTTDSLNPIAPKTEFNIRLTKVSPGVA